VSVERFAQDRECRTKTASGDTGLVNGPDVAGLRRRHRVDERFEPLTQENEEGRALVHTRG
jgi:hypothetical protein